MLVQHLDIPGDGPDLAEPAAVVRHNEPTVQLVALGLLADKDTIYNSTLVVLLLVEYLGRSSSVGLAAVDRESSLFYVGYDLPSRTVSGSCSLSHTPGPRERLTGQATDAVVSSCPACAATWSHR